MNLKTIIIFLVSINIYAFKIQGRIDSSKCKEHTDGQLFVSHESKLVYQIEIPKNGSFAINLPKNTYQFSFVTKEGCGGVENISIEKDLLDIVIGVKRD